MDTPDYPAMKPFVDIATDIKVMVNNRAGGSIVDDFDNDGDLDLVTSGWDVGVDAMHYFRNEGNGSFTDLSKESGLKAFNGGLNIQQTDYNNDGLLDIWVLRGAWQGQGGIYGEQPNSLMRNNGDGTFTDVTIETGLLSACPTQPPPGMTTITTDGSMFLSAMKPCPGITITPANSISTTKTALLQTLRLNGE